jgi:hypothetical protein
MMMFDNVIMLTDIVLLDNGFNICYHDNVITVIMISLLCIMTTLSFDKIILLS